MRKTLQKIAEGRFEYEEDVLQLSKRRLEYMCGIDGEIKGSFFIESKEKQEIKGILYSSNVRMKCEKIQFSGKRIEIPYIFYAKGLDPLTTVKGDIYIESNIGEYNMPFVVTILEEFPKTSIGKIKNLFHFADLAHQNYEEAYKLFVSGKFTEIEMNEQEKMYYHMFSGKGFCRENMEEFLLAVRKKKPMAFTLEEHEFDVKAEQIDFSQSLVISKNGWGYIRIDVSCDADFVRFEKTQLGMEDFVGNHLEYVWFIDVKKLHAGNNYARITFSNFCQEETVDLIIRAPGAQNQLSYLEMKKMRVRLGELYIQIRCKSINTLSWVKESMLLTEKLLSHFPEDEFLLLLKTQLLVLSGKDDDARWILEGFKKKRALKKQKPELYAYFLYVQALYKKDREYTIKAAQEVESLFAAFPQAHGALWALMFLDDGLESNPQKKYQMLKNQYRRGCHSPFLYIEALLLLKEDFSLMNMFDSFERQVLNFAVRQALITEELAVYASSLALNCRHYDKMTVRLIKHFYYFYERRECVEAVCSLLIKGGRRTADCFEWYRRGVAEGLKLNLLYEYYLYTISYDKKELLPKSMLIYFTYNHQLDYRKKAYLYANVTRYREEIEEIYEKYEPFILEFVPEQLVLRHMSEDLMFLYETHFDMLAREQKNREILEELIFAQTLHCQNSKIVRVAVGYKELKKEEIFPVADGKAYIRVYTEDAYVMLEDAKGRRHLKTLEFSIKPMLSEERRLAFIHRLEGKKVGFLLNRYRSFAVITEKGGAMLCRRLMNSGEVTAECAQELLCSLIRFFEKQGIDEEINRLLLLLDFERMDGKKRAFYIEKMILSGLYQEAYDRVVTYGFEKINVKRLVRLCSRRILGGFEEDELMDLCAWVFFKGKYDEVTLQFLADGFCGTTAQMRAVWRAACNFEADASALSERILVQMLFTGFLTSDSDTVFSYYCSQIAQPEVIRAYLSWLSYHYVVYDELVGKDLFAWILKQWKQKEKLNDGCYLAFLKYCASEKEEEMKEAQKKLLVEKLAYFTQKGVALGFMKGAAARINYNDAIQEKTVIEYQAKPDDKVMIHYRIINERGEEADFASEQMQPAFGPIFSKAFTLFSGETLQYYLSQPGSKEEQIVCSCVVTKEPEGSGELNGRYSWLNEMYAARFMRDETFLDTIMQRYAKYEKIAEELFQLKE